MKDTTLETWEGEAPHWAGIFLLVRQLSFWPMSMRADTADEALRLGMRTTHSHDVGYSHCKLVKKRYSHEHTIWSRGF